MNRHVRIKRHERPEVASADTFARLQLRLLLADIAPNLIALDLAARQVAHLLVRQPVAALTDLKAKPHDRIAMRTRHPLDRPDGIALDQGPDNLAAAFDGKTVDHGCFSLDVLYMIEYTCISSHIQGVSHEI